MNNASNLKIIDFDKKGNVVRFYLAPIGCDDYWGDDWDDFPYEHNAGTVYDEYVSHIMDVAFPFDSNVLEPANDWHYEGNSPFSKANFKDRHAPCIIVIPPDIIKQDYLKSDSYAFYHGSEKVFRIYYDDLAERIVTCNMATILSLKRKEDVI